MGLRRLVVFLGLSFFTGVGLATPPVELEILSYNVENLFDTNHDSGKDDWAFLPASTPGKEAACKQNPDPGRRKECLDADWTEDRLALKLEQIKRVFDSLPSRPALVALQEVENESVVRRLASVLGYEGVAITDSPDERGIDVALMYNTSEKLRFLGEATRRLDPEGQVLKKPTRDLLEVSFEFAGQRLALYVCHWPSQEAPTEVRTFVAESLQKWMHETRAKHPGVFQVVVGDLNTISDDHPNPVYETLLAKNSGLGLKDAGDEFWSYHRVRKTDREEQARVPPGTYFFPWKLQWNHLDRFLYQDSPSSKLEWVVPSYQIYSPALIQKSFTFSADPSGKTPSHYHVGTKVTGVPAKYSHKATEAEKAGFSDHFPILGRVRLK